MSGCSSGLSMVTFQANGRGSQLMHHSVAVRGPLWYYAPHRVAQMGSTAPPRSSSETQSLRPYPELQCQDLHFHSLRPIEWFLCTSGLGSTALTTWLPSSSQLDHTLNIPVFLKQLMTVPSRSHFPEATWDGWAPLFRGPTGCNSAWSHPESPPRHHFPSHI